MTSQPLRERLRASTSSAILDAAEAIAAKEGLQGTSLQAVSHRAGVAVGTIYNYFHDRDNLFEELLARRRAELFKSIEAGAKRHSGARFETQLDAFVRAIFLFFDVRRDFLRLVLQPEQIGDRKRRSTIEQLLAQAERIVRVGVREKRLRDLDARLVASVLVSMLRGVLHARADRDAPLASETEAVADLFLHGAAR
jgi:AcrR family transcriptional regulator